MIQDYIPAVLQHSRGSISTYRALKQIKELLEVLTVVTIDEERLLHLEDKINASIDDVDTMMEKVK